MLFSGQIAYLSLDELGLDGGPGLALSGVGEEVHDDGTTADGLINIEQVLAGDPAILLGVLPGLAVLADADDDVEAVVTEVEALAVTLGAVADEGEGVVLEVVLWAIVSHMSLKSLMADRAVSPVTAEYLGEVRWMRGRGKRTRSFSWGQSARS